MNLYSKVNELEDEVKDVKKSVQKLKKANEDQKLIQQAPTCWAFKTAS